MDCATFKELAALLALGALDDAERDACAAHLARDLDHDGCAEELARSMASVDALDDEADAPAPRPRPEVWSAIVRQIAPVQALRRARRVSVVGWSAALACAAIVALLLARPRQPGHDDGGPALATLPARGPERELTAAALRDRDACQAQLGKLEAQARLRAEAVGLLELPGTQLFPLAAAGRQKQSGHAAANAILHTGVKRAYVVADGLLPARDGDYEMWIARGKRVVPAGIFTVDEQGRAVVKIDYARLLDGAAPDTVMVTLEPRGGSTVVRGPTVLVGNPRS